MFTAAKGTQLLTDMVSRGHRQGPDMSDSSQPHRGSCIVALRPYQLEGLTRPGPVCVEADLLQCVLKTTLAANAPQEDVNYFRQHGFAHAVHSFCRAVNAYAKALAECLDQQGEDKHSPLAPDLTVFLKVLGKHGTPYLCT